MGPVNNPEKKTGAKVSEEEILKESEQFILSTLPLIQIIRFARRRTNLSNWMRITIAKITIYGHKTLLDHLKNNSSNETRIRYLEQWRSISFQNMDLLFQNLIKNTMTREQKAVITKIDTHQKYNLADKDELKRLSLRGQDIIYKRKVAVIIFVGTYQTKSDKNWNKEFYKEKQSQMSLFQIMMARLTQIGDKYGFPITYIFYDKDNSEKVNKFISSYKYGDKLHCCVQSSNPVLNLNGSVCLKSKDSGEILQMPQGSGDFYHASIRGMSILQKLKKQKVEYVCCVNCQNMLQTIFDPYLMGLFDMNKDDFDLMYKCTYPQNQSDKIFKRVVMQNEVPKADTIASLTSFANNYNKQSNINEHNVKESPVWMGHVVFNVQKVSSILKSPLSISYFPQAVNYKMKQMDYWSPTQKKIRHNQACYVFDKDLSDLLINNLFKSKGIMVDRQEEYLPVVTQNSEFSWKNAYKQYNEKIKKMLVHLSMTDYSQQECFSLLSGMTNPSTIRPN